MLLVSSPPGPGPNPPASGEGPDQAPGQGPDQAPDQATWPEAAAPYDQGAAPGYPGYPGAPGAPGAPGYAPSYPDYAEAGPPAPPPPTSPKATVSLVLGLVGLFCCGLLAGIPAIIVGLMARGEIKQSEGRVRGDGLALGGIITGAIAVLWSLVAVAVVAAALTFGDTIRDELDDSCVRVVDPDGTVHLECDFDDREHRWFEEDPGSGS